MVKLHNGSMVGYVIENVLVHSLQKESGTEWAQALADILHSALRCHSNEARAPIANLPNSAQLQGTPTITLSYIRVHAVVW